MAEIKSTLDLIMERTKDLVLTEDERKEIRTRERQARVKGWVRRRRDGSLTDDDIRKYLADEGTAASETAALLREECLAHVDPGGDNGRILSLLQTALGMDTAPVEELTAAFHGELERLRIDSDRTARAVLQERGIGGSAVVPNPNLDPEWGRGLERARRRFQERLYRLR
ncbi:MAG: hypothetical protein QM278_06330 [Pseudomonadota bacterium]|nr:hypothetical protein [Pseudomonadota bacterium]